MTSHWRASSSIAALLVLAACVATTPGGAKPNPEKYAATGENPACRNQAEARIAVKGTNCSATGRAYSSDDIRRTGATTVGEALQLLDPSITVQH